MMKDIAVAMITVNRAPRTNYLFDTFKNLTRGGVWNSERLHSFYLVDSGDDCLWCGDIDSAKSIFFVPAEHGSRRTPTDNAAMALMVAGSTDAKWVLFLEDDIDVCDQFLDSVGSWLDDHDRSDRHVFAFGAAYDALVDLHRKGKTSWQYPIDGFYGTQAFAVRAADALSLGKFFMNSLQPSAYDLLMHRWARQNWPETKFFMASVPSFVEHTGRESTIAPRAETHTFQAWVGHGWSYRSKVSA